MQGVLGDFQGDVGRIIGCDGMAQGTNPRQEEIMWIADERPCSQIVQRFSGPSVINEALEPSPTQRIRHLHIDQMGDVERFVRVKESLFKAGGDC